MMDGHTSEDSVRILMKDQLWKGMRRTLMKDRAPEEEEVLDRDGGPRPEEDVVPEFEEDCALERGYQTLEGRGPEEEEVTAFWWRTAPPEEEKVPEVMEVRAPDEVPEVDGGPRPGRGGDTRALMGIANREGRQPGF